MTVGIAIVGTGVMAGWHAEALAGEADAAPRLVVGLGDDAEAFLQRHGFGRASRRLEDAFEAHDIDAVIVATPSEFHASIAYRALSAGQHVLVEAPMAMSFGDAEALVDLARERGRVLAVSHPFRFRQDLVALRDRIWGGAETLHAINGMFYVASQRAPVGRMSPTWTDNVLWHHLSHMADLTHWLAGETGEADGWMGPVEDPPGIPMSAWVAIELPHGSALLSASYHGRDLYEIVFVTDRDTCRLDQRHAVFADSSRSRPVLDAKTQCLEVARDFVRAIADGRDPGAPGASVLPSMRSMQTAQDRWNRAFGNIVLPGRAVGDLADAARRCAPIPDGRPA